MHLKFDNVNDAFKGLVQGIQKGDIPTEKANSRVGEVIRAVEPMVVSYTHPQQKVLFNSTRDVNCYLTMFESLWMLAGRNDVAPLAYYSSKIAGMASDDGVTFNAAYGFRWRHHYASSGDMYDEIDQLELLITHLRKNPSSRRAVLQMWTAADDLLKVDITRDTACNLCCVFSLQNGVINVCVYNRSNDLILGMLGTNVVHFGFLLEYVAAHLGVRVGTYNQITCDLHVYSDNWKPEVWLTGCEVVDYPRPFPLVCNPEVFDAEVVRFIDNPFQAWREPFLESVAKPMCAGFKYYKEGKYLSAVEAARRIEAADWGRASREWIDRRLKRKGVTV